MSKAQENDDIIENAEPISQENVSVEQNEDFYSGFSPLDEPVKERSYTKGNVDSKGLEAELEEPTFDAPNFSDFDEETKEPSTFNPAIDNLDKKEQLYATEQMVDTVLDVYGKAHLLANRVTKIKEDKVAKAMEDGEIDPSLEVPIDNMGNSLGLMDYVQEYNSQLSDAIKLEDDFVEKVKPPMIRVFQKKGLAMTDEQFLAVAFGTDILTKGAMIFQLVKQNNKLFSMWKEQSNFVPKSKPSKPSNSSSTPPPPPTPTPQPSENTPPPTPTFSEPEEFSAESMVGDMTGMKENSNFENSKPSDGMPIFGDKNILSDMEKLARQEEVIDITPTEGSSKKRKRGRPKKSK
jgi:hypothetical protein|tara:strand:+ start:3766 stop:4812 length:1047 start_codon:yes stop_codon:yes gene_type:complete